MRFRHFFILLCLIMALGTSAAFGQGIPPGNSGADQYAEGVPGAGGNDPANGSDTPGETDESGALPQEVVDQLQEDGSTGADAASALAASAPGTGGDRESKAGPGGSQLGQEGSESEGNGTLGELADTVLTGSDGGMGPALPLILLAVAVGTVLLVALRRKSHNSQTPSSG